jgi:hypothetical protein
VIRRLFLAAALAAGALPATAQQAVDLDGQRYEAAATVGGQRLLLNGAGIRFKAVFKVYTAGLYLQARATTPEAALAAPGPKRLHVVMLRDIDGNELGKLFTRGMEDNASRADFSKSITGTLRMADLFSQKKRLAKGENFSVDWVPGTGTQILVNGVAQGEPIKEPEFFTSLMRIWLGNKPADQSLKDALLGKPPEPRRDMTTY